MHKKMQSMVVITILYSVGAFLAYDIYTMSLADTFVMNVLIADIAYTLWIFICSLILRNASLYDPYWSVIPPIALIFTYIEFPELRTLSNVLMITAIVCWSIRLTFNWAKLFSGLDHMDWRYVNFKNKYPKLYIFINLFGIQLMPTLMVFAQISVGIAFMFLKTSLSIGFILGFFVMIVAVIIQLVSDRQMQIFKKDNKDKKKCIDRGLWQYSRHPNYLGEIMVWTGLYIIYLSAAKTIDIYVLAPIAMFLLFNYISIPLMENKILASRPSYAYDQMRISKLLLLPQKKLQEEAFDKS